MREHTPIQQIIKSISWVICNRWFFSCQTRGTFPENQCSGSKYIFLMYPYPDSVFKIFQLRSRKPKKYGQEKKNHGRTWFDLNFELGPVSLTHQVPTGRFRPRKITNFQKMFKHSKYCRIMLIFFSKLLEIPNFNPLLKKQAFCNFGTRELIANTAPWRKQTENAEGEFVHQQVS